MRVVDRFLRRPRRRITIFKSPSSLWYFHIQGDNSKVIAPSEGYKDRRDMLDTLNRYFPEWEVVEDTGDYDKIVLRTAPNA